MVYEWNFGGSLDYTDNPPKNGLTAGSLNRIIDRMIPPIGAIMSRVTNYALIPAYIPAGWVECNGQTLDDSDSVYHGKLIPDLNGSTLTTGSRFLRSTYTSGEIGGKSSHIHRGITNIDPSIAYSAGTSGTNIAAEAHFHRFTTGYGNSDPPYYTVRWMMRIK